MKLIAHGSACCGIKTIFNIPGRPSLEVAAIRKPSHPEYRPDLSHSGRGKVFYRRAAAHETGLRRLDRYLAYCDRLRKNGIVEVVLADNGNASWAPNQSENWHPHLEERGFKLVNSCKNSNSGNTVFVYHRNSGEVPAITFEEEKK